MPSLHDSHSKLGRVFQNGRTTGGKNMYIFFLSEPSLQIKIFHIFVFADMMLAAHVTPVC